MRKMQDFILEGKEVFIGLEDSKRKWKVCVRSGDIIVHEVSMPAHYENLRNYLLHRFPGCKVTVIYEAGFRGFWLHDLLACDGIGCIVTPPNKVTQEKDNRVKNDKIDARRLSKILEHKDYKSCYVPDKELREDRQVSRTLLQIQKDITRTKNRIKRFFDFHGLSDNGDEIHWRVSDYKYLKHVCLSDSLRFSLDILINELEVLLEYRRMLKRKLHALSKKQRYKETFSYFESCPGIGWLSAIRFVLEWGEDLSRFIQGRKFSSYLGLAGSEYSSGDDERRGHITKQGKGFVRAWLIQCAWVGYKKDPVLLKKFMSVLRSTRSKKMAIVAVARKLAVRLWHLSVFKEKYVIGLLEEQTAAA